MAEPITLSMAWNVEPEAIDAAGAIDVMLNCDTNLFIDPLLLAESENREFGSCASAAYEARFSTMIDLLAASKQEGDVAWRAAVRLLSFHELAYTHLGYSSGTSGSGFGAKLSGNLLLTAKEVVDLGVINPDLFMALALFEEGIGADRISDMTTNIILECLAAFSKNVADQIGIDVIRYTINGKHFDLPPNPLSPTEPLLLVPKDVVRDLPVAADWSSIASAAQETDDLRDRVNRNIGELWKARTRAQKQDVLRAALRSKDAFGVLLDLVKDAAHSPYDLDADHRGEIYPAELRKHIAATEPLDLHTYSGRVLERDEVNQVVILIINKFKDLVENKGLWKDLWGEGRTKARLEKAYQRLFYAVACAYCEANNLDLSPESDGGAGPVDFKMSQGANNKVIVEIKKSTNSKLVEGYTKQLDAYRAAEGTTVAHYVIIDIGSMTEGKVRGLSEARSAVLRTGFNPSSWVLIDGRPQASASKR